MKKNFIDLTGHVFHRLRVLERDPKNTGSHEARWKCLCDPELGGCGGSTTVSSYNLRKELTKSCGCLLKDLFRSGATKSTIHGLSHTPEHSAWRGAKKRCYNTKDRDYHDYGGRGITMCDEWKDSFITFYNDIGPRPTPEHSLDRRNNDLGYSKENCHWATKLEQSNNQRSNIFYLHKGVCRTLAAWCRELNLDQQQAYSRKHSGWTFEEIIGIKPR